MFIRSGLGKLGENYMTDDKAKVQVIYQEAKPEKSTLWDYVWGIPAFAISVRFFYWFFSGGR